MNLCDFRCSDSVLSGFDGFDAVLERRFQNGSADGSQHEAEHPSFEILALAHDHDVNVGCVIGLTREGVSVAGSVSPHRNIGLCSSAVMHLEIFVGAVAKQFQSRA